MRQFGISPCEFTKMLINQDGRCAVCKTNFEEAPACVDHNHATGAVRGLLCHNCNLGIGNFRDDPELLSAAISYLVP